MCNIVTGITKACEYSVAGNQTDLYLGNASEVSVTIGMDGTATAISGSFVKFELAKDSVVDTCTIVLGAAQNKYWTHSVAFKSAQSVNADAEAIEDLGLAKVVAVVHGKDNKYKVYGSPTGLEVSELAFTSGAADADDFGWTGTMTNGFTTKFSYVSGSIAPTLVSGSYVFSA
jgi:hypothetical protein